MRIAQIAPIPERVPPKKYGGTERVIYYLTEELVKRGHEVTLFASGDSITSANLISVVPKPLRETKFKDIYGFNTPSMKNIGLAYSMQDQFDIIHDHNPHISLPTANIATTPVVVTWHGPYFPDIIDYFKIFKNVHLVSISNSQAEPAKMAGINFAGTVYNGLDLDNVPYSPSHKGYLAYIGRIDKEKGTHIAIDAAVRLKRKLILAGKLDKDIPHIYEYYIKFVLPRLVKYKSLVRWIGEVDDKQRNKLLKDAECLIHPITWPEPFGLTLVESMACGTPAVAYRLGSMMEVIKHGVTGYVVDNFKQLLAAIKQVGKLNRETCRTYALANFNAKRMADGYEAVYQKILAENGRFRSEQVHRSEDRQRIIVPARLRNPQRTGN